MGEIDTYSLIDFMPMEPEVYLRLFVRQNQSMWPFQVVAVVLGIACLWLAWHRRERAVGGVLGAACVWVGYSFFLDLYAELNWAAEYVGWAFVVQGAVVAGYGLMGRLAFPEPDERTRFHIAGLAVAALSLVAYPFLVPLGGRSWAGLEVFGAAPDPTALVLLGFVLAAEQVRWPLLLVPVLWCGYSGLTSVAMGWPVGLVAPAIAISATGIAIWRWLATD